MRTKILILMRQPVDTNVLAELEEIEIAEPKKIRPAADPLPSGTGQPKFNQLEMITTFTYRPSLVKIDAHNFELSW